MEVVNGVNAVFKRDGRLAVDDLVIHCLHDGTFDVATVPEQTALGADRSIPKIMDRYKDDLSGDPYYRSLLVKLLPSETCSELQPKNLALIDRHLKVGQLVKRGPQSVGYIRSIQQTASARIYLSDETARNDPARELYVYKKPAEFYGKLAFKIGDIVQLNGWLGEINEMTNNLAFTVDFKNGTHQDAHSTDLDLFKVMPNANNETQNNTLFDINSIHGLFPDRTFNLPYKSLKGISSLRWTGTDVDKPSNNSEKLVGITIKRSQLHTISVAWGRQIPDFPGSLVDRPNKLVKNEVDRGNLQLVSHSEGLKLGDVCSCNMSEEDWSRVLAKCTWQNTVSKDYYLHRRRHKRQRMNEGRREVLPAKPYPRRVSVEIMLTSTKAEVEWMNTGLIEPNIDSRDLVPVRCAIAVPGTLVHTPEGRHHHHPSIIVMGVGTRNTANVHYAVIQSMSVTKAKITTYRPKGYRAKWTIQEYQLPAGALQPVPHGPPREIDGTETDSTPSIIGQWNLWQKNCCKVVVKMPNSTADFMYGCVVGLFPDGHIRIKRPDGEFISVWPTDVVGISTFLDMNNLRRRLY